jgi:phosphatidylinositol alpha-mannosyltransferase
VRVGLVCPYSLDVPGGVQSHVRGLAEALIGLGHDVSVLAPSESDDLPSYVVPAGRAVPVPYNGSVARVSFGPVTAARVRRWLHDGAFDVLHLHEPATPSLSLLALWAAECPVVATYHTSNERSRALSATAAILRPSLEKVSARIAVSEHARDTLVTHVGGEPVVIPNGVYVDRFASAEPRADWRGDGGTVAFVGRLGEPRKGFEVLARAFGKAAAGRPGCRLLVVGGGDVAEARELLPEGVRDQALFLGPVDDHDKAVALRTADVYVAPNTGGESFGIVVVEAMAAGTTVLASDLPAFRRVLADGTCGELFTTGDADELASRLTALLDDPARRAALDAAARGVVRRYDWSTVAGRILRVYETVAGSGS